MCIYFPPNSHLCFGSSYIFGFLVVTSVYWGEKASMKLIPSLEFVFGQRKPLHLPLKCIHFWAGMPQLLPSLRRHTRQSGLRMRPRIPGRWNWRGHFKSTGCNYPNWNEARGLSGGPSHLLGKRIPRYLTRASGQDLHCRSHFKGRHFKTILKENHTRYKNHIPSVENKSHESLEKLSAFLFGEERNFYGWGA